MAKPQQNAGVADKPLENPPQPSELDRVKAELEVVKLNLRKVKEERCLDELQRVLEKHGAKLTSLPGGNFQVTIE